VLIEMLSQLFPRGVGLPIRFEGSAPLANLFLLPLDAAVSDEGMDFVRWTDDVDVFLPDPCRGPALLALAKDRLADAHLQLNDDKSEVVDKGPAAEQRLLDPARDSLLGDDAAENVKSRLELHQWMKRWGLHESVPPAHMRTYLGVLRNAKDPGALAYLAERPEWLDREPRAVGDYIAALSDDSAARAAIDADWLFEAAIGRDPSEATEAGQLHACRAMAGCRLDRARSAVARLRLEAIDLPWPPHPWGVGDAGVGDEPWVEQIRRDRRDWRHRPQRL
jgi:hypothetical protein